MCLGAITITPTVQLVPKPDNLLHYTHQRRYSLAERGTVCTRQIIQRAQTTGDLFGIEIKRARSRTVTLLCRVRTVHDIS